MISMLSALHVAGLVTNNLADGDDELLARLTRNRLFTGDQIRQRLRRELGVRGITKPPRIEESGLQILFDAHREACWLVIPVWQRGIRSDVVVEVEVVSDDRDEHITLHRIGPAGEVPAGYTRIADSEIVEEIRRQERIQEQSIARAKEYMLTLRTEPAPVLPEGPRAVAQTILDGLVEGRYDDVAELGDGLGLPSDIIADVIAGMPGPLVRPPQGLPPGTAYLELSDGTGSVLQVPLWTTEYATEYDAFIVTRNDKRGVAGYLADIRQG